MLYDLSTFVPLLNIRIADSRSRHIYHCFSRSLVILLQDKNNEVILVQVIRYVWRSGVYQCVWMRPPPSFSLVAKAHQTIWKIQSFFKLSTVRAVRYVPVRTRDVSRTMPYVCTYVRTVRYVRNMKSMHQSSVVRSGQWMKSCQLFARLAAGAQWRVPSTVPQYVFFVLWTVDSPAERWTSYSTTRLPI